MGRGILGGPSDSEVRSLMCLTCGCLRPHEDHGNPNHITIEDLERSAAIDNLTLDEAVHSLRMTVEIAKQEADQTT